jgi:hypothetical protein
MDNDTVKCGFSGLFLVRKGPWIRNPRQPTVEEVLRSTRIMRDFEAEGKKRTEAGTADRSGLIESSHRAEIEFDERYLE